MTCKNGYVTVYFTLLLTILFSFFTALIYGVRENAMRLKIYETADTSVTSMFAEFQSKLWEKYDLIFVDAGYGGKAESLILTEDHLKSCATKNFEEDGSEILHSTDLLGLECDGVKTSRIRFATDGQGEAIRQQAARIMKYRYSVGYIEDLYESLSDNVNSQTFSGTLMEETVEKASGADDSLPELKEWSNTLDGCVYKETEVSSFSTLRTVFSDIDGISKAALKEEGLVSRRDLNAGNYDACGELDATEVGFFKEYLLEYLSNFRNEKEGTVLKYEAEYVIAGHMEDAENLEAVVNRILLTREAANLTTLMSDSRKMEEIRVYSEVLAGLLLSPETAPAIEALIIGSLSYVESLNDVRVLISGGKVPILKDTSEWRTNFANVFFEERDTSSYETGIEYSDYLRGFLYLEDTEKETERFMDICEANVRNLTGNNDFRLDYCFDAWAGSLSVTSRAGYTYTVSKTGDIED